MHVCAIPQQPTSHPGPRSPTWPASWRRWSPKKPWSSKVAAGAAPSAGNGTVVRKNRRARLTSSFMRQGRKKDTQAASRHQFYSIEKEQHRFYSVEKDFDDTCTMASTRQSEDVPLLEIDEKVSPWIVETSRPRSMRNTRCRIRRLLRLHRRRPGSKNGGNATKSPRNAKKASQDPVKTLETINDKGNGSPSQHWAYNLALGLAWYMPAPYDMMPQGYPSRVF
ncbi:hypothetical protein CKAH01_01039 [Colletotrichum kahawae]|uniref:Uncharacterized protein n=1 Tax=Colletotrichum kahawae TaxID=34407 RepID=A0AAD9YCF8_COLKA|nr:hypothetical protein CKAH01_01039 [Colletotrichum kahawae]